MSRDEPALHEAFGALRTTLPFRSLHAGGPTPVFALADGLWVKDELGFGDGGWGGNKVRKLEWLLPDAARRGKRTILTVGGLGTNWGLATALYGQEAGLQVALALVDQPVDDHVREQLARLRASGAALHFTRSKARTIALAPWLLARHRLPYYLPAGGSSDVGVLGYVEAAFEIAAQVRDGALPEPSHVVCAVGSGGTVAGLLLGLRLAGLGSVPVGVVVNDTLPLSAKTLRGLAGRGAALLRSRGANLPGDACAGELLVVDGFMGDGYGHPTAAAAAAAARYGDRLELDPVYTAKAMAATLALMQDGTLGGPVLFLQTNGPRPTSA